jgi:two-component system sensor histidine kinase FlrB
MATADVKLLENAFNEFSKASDSIITYYNVLESQIRELKRELEEKNRALERASEYLYTILDSLPVGVAVVDKKSILFVNKQAEELVSEGIIARLNNGVPKTGEIKTGSGHFRWRKEKLCNGFDDKEVIAIEHVTEVERVKEKNERDERILAMGEMAARISHEITNPLGSMELFLSMMLSGRLNKTQRKYADYILFGVKTIDRIINNILSYTRPKTLALKEGQLYDVVRNTIDFMSISISIREINVEFHTTCRGDACFDPDLIKLVLMNLISNAIEAIGKKGRIKVDIKESGGFAVIIISDSGIGMSEEVRKNIFNPFFTTKDKGVGLGLFIVYNIIKAHGGTIEVESAENSGSSFLIYIPKEKVSTV